MAAYIESIKKTLFPSKENEEHKEDVCEYDLTTKLCEKYKNKAEKSEKLKDDFADWAAGEVMKLFHIAGTKFEESLKNAILGECDNSNDSS